MKQKAKPDHTGGRFEFFGVVILKITPERPWGIPVKRIEGHNKIAIKEMAAEFIYFQKREPGVTYETREIDYR